MQEHKKCGDAATILYRRRKARVTRAVVRWNPRRYCRRARSCLQGSATGQGWQEYCKGVTAGFRAARLFQKGTWMTKLVTIVTALALAVPALCSGQYSVASTRLEIDRAELASLLDQYEAIVRSTAYSDVLRGEVSDQADLIRERLSMGDFQPGNQIVLSFEAGGSVQTDTLTVESGPLIDVPTLGPILLHGVLRSELATHLATEIGRFIQTPRFQARALIRVSVAGDVGRPGFYALPTDLRLSDVVTLAGGATGGADPGRIRVERGQDVLWTVEELLVPVADGRTLDDLGLQPGDRVILRGGSASLVQSPFLQRLIQSLPFILVSLLLGRTIR